MRCIDWTPRQISLRGPFLPPLLRNKTLVQPYFGTDLVHIAQPLHTAIGELVIAYLQEQRCEVLDELRYGEPADLLPGEGLLLDKVIPGEVPSVSHPHFAFRDVRGLIPDSQHTLDQEILSEPVNPTAPPVCHLAGQTLQPLSPSPDWSVFLYQNEKTSLIAAEAGKAISFEVEVREGGAGEVGIAFLRSSNPEYNLGRLRCRVGGQEEALNGCWPSAISVFECASFLLPLSLSRAPSSQSLSAPCSVGIIAKNVKPDKHRVDCVTLAGAVPERNAYRIAAVMSR